MFDVLTQIRSSQKELREVQQQEEAKRRQIDADLKMSLEEIEAYKQAQLARINAEHEAKMGVIEQIREAIASGDLNLATELAKQL